MPPKPKKLLKGVICTVGAQRGPGVTELLGPAVMVAGKSRPAAAFNSSRPQPL